MTALFNNGFMLIEMLVVVLIIGILAAIALPQYQKAVMKSRLTRLKLLAHSIAQAQEEVYLATGAYTSDMDALAVSLPQPSESNKDAEGGELTLIYPWGICHLLSVAIECRNEYMSIKYMVYYIHTSKNRAGNRECTANKSNPLAVSICKQDTNQTEPFWHNTDYVAFSY